MKSNSYIKAVNEFNILEKLNDPENPYVILEFKYEVLALIDKFGESGQSGGSAPYTARVIADTIKKLCMHETISPLTGDDNEWSNPFEDTYQNTRNSAVFKKTTDSQAYYLDAIVWQGEDKYDTFTGTVENISSFWYIKKFPFTPKTFYIDVTREIYNPDVHGTEDSVRVVSCGDGDYVYKIKDPNQLTEVMNYYDRTK